MMKDAATATFVKALGLSHRNNDDFLGWCPGYFANVVEFSKDVSLAFAMDGIGLKVVLARLANNYEVIGYDCMAASLNDLICVGATPIGFMDYIHMAKEDEKILDKIATGFKNASMDCGVNILGGEVSIYGSKKKNVLDVCGVAFGKSFFRTPIMGHDIRQGNIIIGLHSTGIHCNGTTEAIKAFTSEELFNTHPILKQPLIDALLTPTAFYSPIVTNLFKGGVKPTGLVNISGGGIKNLLRLQTQGVAFEFDYFPEVPDLFKVIRLKTEMRIEEMINVFNMGIGFYLIIQQDEIDLALKILDRHTLYTYSVMGKVVASDMKRVSWSMSHENM